MKKSTFFGAAIVLGTVGFTHAAELTLDFSDAAQVASVEFFGDAELRDEGGVQDADGTFGGYLKITDRTSTTPGSIVFPDLDEGVPVERFKISADLRVGGGTSRPADGFSFNFVRPDDPVLDDGIVWAGGDQNGVFEMENNQGNGLPEEGTRTGLAIGFDTWQSGTRPDDCNQTNDDDVIAWDCIGISVRVDGEMVRQVELPELNGTVDNQNALTTNLTDDFLWGGPDSGDPDPGALNFELDDLHNGEDLGWARLEIEYNDGNLFVAYKGREIINEAIEYEVSTGFLVFGGRVGGANAFHHIDNISIMTNSSVVGGLACDFDADGILGVGDIDLLLAEVRAGTNGAGFDVTADGIVDTADIKAMVEGANKFNSYVGDSNLDGEFNSSDFVTVFTAGQYEDAVALNSTWGTGDWNGDGDFNSSDFVFAFSSGGYELGPRAAVAAVPEPSSCILLVLGGLMAIRRRR